MILLIARRELLGHLRSARLRALFVLVVALLATGTFADVRRYEARVRYADALETMRTTAAALERTDPESVTSRYGWRAGRATSDPALRAIRPPVPASVFALGSDLTAPGSWQFGTEGVAPGPSLAVDDGRHGAVATLDLTFVVRAVLSLVALLVAADTIAGDRERGVLRTLFAAPVSRLDVMLGKYVGGVLALGVPLTLGVMASTAIVALTHPALLGAGLGLRVMLLIAGSAAFLAVMLAFGTWVSARCRDAQTAVVALVAAWALLVVVLPAAAPLAAALARPVQPDELAAHEETESIRQLEVERAHALAAIWRRVSGVASAPDAASFTPDLRRRYDDARHGVDDQLMRRKRAVLRDARDERRRLVARQRALVAAVDLLSPAATFDRLAATVAGTSDRSMDRWQRAADDQQQRLEAAMFDRPYGTDLYVKQGDMLRISFLPNASDPAERLPHYDELPAFAPPRLDLGADVRGALPAFGLLVAHNVVFLALAGVAVARMEV